MKTINLNMPIQGHDEEITELKMREPLAGDIVNGGMPITFNGEGEVKINTRTISTYISMLCNIPPSSVAKLSLQDFLELQREVLDFFGDGRKTLTT